MLLSPYQRTDYTLGTLRACFPVFLCCKEIEIFLFLLNRGETEVTKRLLNVAIRHRQIRYRHEYRLGIGRSIMLQI